MGKKSVSVKTKTPGTLDFCPIMQFPQQMMQCGMMPQQGMMMPQYSMMMPQQQSAQPGTMGMQMPAGGMMQQQQMQLMPPAQGEAARRERSRSPAHGGGHSLPARPSFADDASRMSISLQSLGMVWKVGKDRCCSKKMRDSMVCSCNSHQWPMIRLSTISDEYTDMLLFSATGIGPPTKPGNFWG